MDEAKEENMSAVPLAQFAPTQVRACGLTVGGQSAPSSTPPSFYPPWKYGVMTSHSLCGQQKHFSSWKQAQTRELYIECM